jgi:flagellar biosynthesis protein FliR
MHIRNVPGYWALMAIIVIIFSLVVNAAILYRMHKIDKTKPGQFRWFTLKSVLLGVALGLVALFLLNAGLWIALK